MKQAVAALSVLFSSYTYAANEELDTLRASSMPQNEWRLIKDDKTRNVKAYDKRDEGKSLGRIRS